MFPSARAVHGEQAGDWCYNAGIREIGTLMNAWHNLNLRLRGALRLPGSAAVRLCLVNDCETTEYGNHTRPRTRGFVASLFFIDASTPTGAARRHEAEGRWYPWNWDWMAYPRPFPHAWAAP